MSCSAKAAPMTKDETMHLVQLVAASNIINNKATNATNNKLKEQAWQRIKNEFNSSVTTFPRTPSQLRLKWENLKKAARKRCANMRSSLNKTGGGKDYFPPDEALDKVASLLGNTCQGFNVEFGGDAIRQNLNLVSGEVDLVGDSISSITYNEDEHGDGDVVCNGGVGVGGLGDGGVGDIVLKEMNITNTPSPKQKNLFFSRASGSGALAKRKYKMEEEKCKARIFRENALAEYLIAKKKKIDLENEATEVSIVKLKLELDNAKLENLKLKADLNLME